jgi:predicted small metal-binding protein
MKHFDCGSLVPGCDWHADADSDAEIVRREVDHLKSAHGETEIRPAMIERIKERIVERETAH